MEKEKVIELHVMIRKAALAFALALAVAGHVYGQTDQQVAERLTPTVHTCEKSPENGGTMEQALCYKDEAERQYQRLNKTWAQVIDGTPPARRDTLRRSERKWIKDRDDDCRDEASGYINSTARYMFNVCMANENIRRTMWLESVR